MMTDPVPGTDRGPGLERAPLFDAGLQHPDRFWVAAGYQRSWLNSSRTRTPLLTTGPANAPIVGVLGQPGTAVLFDTDQLDDTLQGIQAEIGVWADPDRRLSLAVSSFYVRNPTYVAFTSASDAAGSPVIARPVRNAVTNAEQSYLIANANLLAGTATISAQSELFGIEANAAWHTPLADNCVGSVLFGYRALRLSESLYIRDRVTPLDANIVTFNSVPVVPPAVIVEQSGFQTINEFNGLQLGGRLHWQPACLFLDAFGKLALGWNDQRVKIDGGTSLVTPAGTQFSPAEVLTSITNIGSERRQVFSIVPEVGADVGIDLFSFLRVRAGYSILAWNRVARAADQIDRNVNPSRVPTDPDFGNVTGPAQPSRIFQDQVLWVQSVNFGLEIHY